MPRQAQSAARQGAHKHARQSSIFTPMDFRRVPPAVCSLSPDYDMGVHLDMIGHDLRYPVTDSWPHLVESCTPCKRVTPSR